MPKFPELDASLGEPLHLPVPLPAGQTKTYSVPPVDAETWTWLSVRFNARDDEEVDDAGETALWQRCLGPVYGQLVEDKASWEQIRRCGLTALAWHVQGEEHAMTVWVGGVPKRQSTSETSTPAETPEEGPSTPTPASETGTTPTRKRRPSPGQTSSNAGTS